MARSANFGYLMEHEPLLAYDGASAESYVYTDPASALFKSRHFIEIMTCKLAERVGVSRPDRLKLEQRINELASASILDAAVRTTLHFVRREGNEGVHGRVRDAERALRVVHSCFDLGLWLHNVLTRREEVRAFVPPHAQELPTPATTDDGEALDQIRERLTVLERRLLEQAGDGGPGRGAAWLTERQSALTAEVRDQEVAIERRWDELYAGFAARLEADRKGAAESDAVRAAIAGAGRAWAAGADRLAEIAAAVASAQTTGGYGATSVVNVAGDGSMSFVIGNAYGGTFHQTRGDGSGR
ncbi:DUF4145 domain-containing protein [Hamadaea tsunoensis]|uniref:DUF4145 domain-containing protein n=1 Tax=Hamadaea tsunoensis TaxID=53368 RepID=UPI000488BE6B|nr:DUF4145 domain-containing protein [Hamadaea tsunoensis]